MHACWMLFLPLPFCSLSSNRLGETGGAAVAEALKTNTYYLKDLK